MYLDNPALFTDYYEVSMVQGYIGSGIADKTATFDYFFRSLPFDSGYLIFAGLSDLIQTLESFIFTKDDLQFLESIGLSTTCTEWLKKFKFQGSVYSVQEGEPVFPGEPVLRVEGGLAELQLIETLLLNILNFQSLIATKASRLRSAAGDKKVIDFGLRRAQGLGGIHASKAAILGGVDATSNLYSAHRFGLASGGTMAHSWVQSFTNELTAFRSYAEIWPDDTVLLVDTYDTLESGVPNAITVAKEMRDRGHELQGIRIDSGDLAWFSRQARTMLDQAGFSGVKIAASNQIDEDVICALNSQDAPIDLFGVGTRLVTADGAPALDGVYKLSSIGGEPTLKISDSP
ncbi:MAG: nicotinate phosphoribosyltransferase, partial [Balneolaceae bacterium]